MEFILLLFLSIYQVLLFLCVPTFIQINIDISLSEHHPYATQNLNIDYQMNSKIMWVQLWNVPLEYQILQAKKRRIWNQFTDTPVLNQLLFFKRCLQLFLGLEAVGRATLNTYIYQEEKCPC